MLGTANLVLLIWLLVNARMWARKGVWMWLLLSSCVFVAFLLGPSLLQFIDTHFGTATTGVQQTLLRTDDGVVRWAGRFAPLEIVLAITVGSTMTAAGMAWKQVRAAGQSPSHWSSSAEVPGGSSPAGPGSSSALS